MKVSSTIERSERNKKRVPGNGKENHLIPKGKYEAKTMMCVFFRSSGSVLIHVVERGKAIDNIYYLENCLGPAFDAIREQRPNSDLKWIKLLHDNARPHVHSNTRNFIVIK